MTDEEKLTAGYDMLYLVRCALFSEKADISKLNSDLSLVYHMAQFHSMTSLCTYALDGVLDRSDKVYMAFNEVRNKAITKNAMFDIERQALFEYCEENGIRYMPLKGIIIKEYYPNPAMRQMADNDIWYDRAYQKQMTDWFVARGYSADSVYKSNDDVFKKPPVFNFEMHTALYGKSHEKGWSTYYEEKFKSLLSTEEKRFCVNFSDEDFYVYFISHAYKHYTSFGTGLRTFADLYVLTKHFGYKLNREYITEELNKLRIAEFEKEVMSLCRKIFTDDGLLTKEEQSVLETVLLCGTYGTLENRIKNKLTKINKGRKKITFGSRVIYIMTRLFLNPKYMKIHYHAKYVWMLPFCYIYRFFIKVFPNINKIRKELKIIFIDKKQED